MIRAHGMQQLNVDLYPVPYTSTSIHMYRITFTYQQIYMYEYIPKALHTVYVCTNRCTVNDKSTASSVEVEMEGNMLNYAFLSFCTYLVE